jgi:hypothetical protein
MPKYPFSETVLCESSGYREGFLSAADILADRICDFKQDKTVAFDVNVIGLIYPTLYLYRHFIELVLKDCISKFKQKKTGHNLLEAYNLTECDLSKRCPPNLTDRIRSCKNLIEFFHGIDKKGEAFRYALDNSGNPHFKESREFDLKDIKSRVADFYSFMKEEYDL